eukprot:Opistho-1_new@68054
MYIMLSWLWRFSSVQLAAVWANCVPLFRESLMFKAPGQLPPLSLLLDDLPTRCARSIARHLGITSQTLKRYQVEDQAPRLVQLALFWETRWGQSVLDCEIFNRDQVQRSHIGALQREGDQLKAQISRLVELVDRGDHGAANSPLWAPLGDAGCGRAPGGPLPMYSALI